MNDDGSTQALVLGSGGYLGKKLIESPSGLFTAMQVCRVETIADLPRFAAQVRAALDGQSRTVLVNCIGLRAGTSEDMHLVNASIPATLAEVVTDCGSHLIHIGSAAEIVAPLAGVSPLQPLVAGALAYGASKREGSSACLRSPRSSVLRVYNIHGLPHQRDSGIHQICLARSLYDNGMGASALVNTTRDYVDWQTVVTAIEETVASGPVGMKEICSGVGVSVADILRAMNDAPSRELTSSLRAADLFGPVVGPGLRTSTTLDESQKVATRLAMEVIRCGSL